MLNVGDRVVINLPDRQHGLEINLPDEMWAFNGQKMRVTKKRLLGAKRNYGPYIELDKAVSKHGIPFAFLPAWLKKVKR